MAALGLAGILSGLALLIWFAYRGWSVLLLAPIAAIVAALFSREPLLAHWTQTFMGSAAGLLARFFPLFLLGALFGKLMEDSGSVAAIARFMTDRLGPRRAVLAVGTLDSLPHNGAVVTLLAVCGSTHGESYRDIVIVRDRRTYHRPRCNHHTWIVLRLFLARRARATGS